MTQQVHGAVCSGTPWTAVFLSSSRRSMRILALCSLVTMVAAPLGAQDTTRAVVVVVPVPRSQTADLVQAALVERGYTIAQASAMVVTTGPSGSMGMGYHATLSASLLPLGADSTKLVIAGTWTPAFSLTPSPGGLLPGSPRSEPVTRSRKQAWADMHAVADSVAARAARARPTG